MIVSVFQSAFMMWGFYAWQPYFLELLGRRRRVGVGRRLGAHRPRDDRRQRRRRVRRRVSAPGARRCSSPRRSSSPPARSVWAWPTRSGRRSCCCSSRSAPWASAARAAGVRARGRSVGGAGDRRLVHLDGGQRRRNRRADRARLPLTGAVGRDRIRRRGIDTLLALPPIVLLRRLREPADVDRRTANRKRAPCAAQGLPEVATIDATPRQPELRADGHPHAAISPGGTGPTIPASSRSRSSAHMRRSLRSAAMSAPAS